MKKRIVSTVSLDSGSYLLDRGGQLIPVKLHVPSTTYVGRGKLYVAPTDAEFLLACGYISLAEAISALLHDFIEYLKEYGDGETYSIVDVTNYNSYAELRYAPTLRQYAMTHFLGGSVDELVKIASEYPSFDEINSKYYSFLCNNFVKVSRFGSQVEFRISSDDNFNWNQLIIDEVILNPDYNISNCKFSILKEIRDKYRAYFINVRLDEILENDKVVLSNTQLTRMVVNGVVRYFEK